MGYQVHTPLGIPLYVVFLWEAVRLAHAIIASLAPNATSPLLPRPRGIFLASTNVADRAKGNWYKLPKQCLENTATVVTPVNMPEYESEKSLVQSETKL